MPQPAIDALAIKPGSHSAALLGLGFELRLESRQLGEGRIRIGRLLAPLVSRRLARRALARRTIAVALRTIAVMIPMRLGRWREVASLRWPACFGGAALACGGPAAALACRTASTARGGALASRRLKRGRRRPSVRPGRQTSIKSASSAGCCCSPAATTAVTSSDGEGVADSASAAGTSAVISATCSGCSLSRVDIRRRQLEISVRIAPVALDRPAPRLRTSADAPLFAAHQPWFLASSAAAIASSRCGDRRHRPPRRAPARPASAAAPCDSRASAGSRRNPRPTRRSATSCR